MDDVRKLQKSLINRFKGLMQELDKKQFKSYRQKTATKDE